MGVDTECLKGCEDYENSCPAVIEGEGEVDEKFISERLSGVMFLDDVVDMLKEPECEKRGHVGRRRCGCLLLRQN